MKKSLYLCLIAGLLVTSNLKAEDSEEVAGQDHERFLTI